MPTSFSRSTSGVNLNSHEDSFLAQTLDIPLTQQDRQEGYDVELLRSQPRGGERGERGVSNNKLRNSTEIAEGGVGNERKSYEKVPLNGGTGSMNNEKYLSSTGGLLIPSNGGVNETDSNLPPISPITTTKRRKWYLRPLPIAIILLILLVVILGVGLGVGLGTKKDKDDTATISTNSTSITNSTISHSSGTSLSTTTLHSTVSHINITSHATTGTVIPNTVSLTDAPFTSPTPTPAPIATSTIGTGGALVGAGAPPSNNPNSGTHLATSGNLPIPESVSTTIGGVFISALTGSEPRKKRSMAKETGSVNTKERRREEERLRRS